MALNTVGSVIFPYCMERMEDDKWILLNREYKPIGFGTYDLVDYGSAPVVLKISRLGESTLKRLSVDGKIDGKRVHLYRDDSAPWLNRAHFENYTQRLQILQKLRVRTSRSTSGIWKPHSERMKENAASYRTCL